MPSRWWIVGWVVWVSGCWVTNAELRAKVRELDEPGESADTGEPADEE